MARAIGELTAAAEIGDNDNFVLEQDGVAKKLIGRILRAWISKLALDASQDAAADAKASAERSAAEAAASLETVLEKEASAKNAADEAAQSLVGANAAQDNAEEYAAKAKEFADTAAGYAGAATVSIGWDADGYFSIFEQEDE